jgi:hypothetical protein
MSATRHGAGRVGWERVFDELRLPARAFERHNGQPCDRCRDLGAQVATHLVETQIETGRGARRCQHVTVVHIEHVRVDVESLISIGDPGGAYCAAFLRRALNASVDIGAWQV